jgi:hypothetical protein
MHIFQGMIEKGNIKAKTLKNEPGFHQKVEIIDAEIVPLLPAGNPALEEEFDSLLGGKMGHKPSPYVGIKAAVEGKPAKGFQFYRLPVNEEPEIPGITGSPRLAVDNTGIGKILVEVEHGDKGFPGGQGQGKPRTPYPVNALVLAGYIPAYAVREVKKALELSPDGLDVKTIGKFAAAAQIAGFAYKKG